MQPVIFLEKVRPPEPRGHLARRQRHAPSGRGHRRSTRSSRPGFGKKTRRKCRCRWQFVGFHGKWRSDRSRAVGTDFAGKRMRNTKVSASRRRSSSFFSCKIIGWKKKKAFGCYVESKLKEIFLKKQPGPDFNQNRPVPSSPNWCIFSSKTGLFAPKMAGNARFRTD